MISIQGLKVEFGSQVLFENISYVVNKRDKIALVGKNGRMNSPSNRRRDAPLSTCSRWMPPSTT